MLKIAVGVIKNQSGEVLISQRAEDVHQGGLWEFPGGKLESGESTFQALKRELFEELSIEVLSAKPFLVVQHQYDDVSVNLDVYSVDEFQGAVRGMEQQVTKWVTVSELAHYAFPAANQVIIDRLNLPHYYPIIDECLGDDETLLNHLDSLISRGFGMIQLRAKSKSDDEFKALAFEALNKCKLKNVRLFLNTNLDVAKTLNAKAVHLNGAEFKKIKHRSTSGISFAVSCHTQMDLKNAYKSGALFAVLSPVKKTNTHVDVKPLGWKAFADMVGQVSLPVFALGGIGPENLDKAVMCGGYGISGIRLFVNNALKLSHSIN
ncbi:MAG: DNA mismatch repair protein MutT [Cycloclasticus sp.]|nr:MAG: DNA mismatch repair protein MutT [Cycloclasticus sp.]